MKGCYHLSLYLTALLLLVVAYTEAHSHHHYPPSQKILAYETKDGTPAPLIYSNGEFNLEVIDHELQQCRVVKDLNMIVKDQNAHEEESLIQQLFTALFPFGPAVNAILATTYISGPPNLLLALIPPQIDPSSLSTLVSFAVGGLLGDVFLHLLPQTFLGESGSEGAKFVLVDDHRNTILGLAMFCGFAGFLILEKIMRIITSGSEGHGHSHSHSHSHSENKAESSSVEITEKTNTALKNRKGEQQASTANQGEEEASKPSSSVKLSAYLNLIADFTHNITDGLAISSSFFVSQNVGATTCLAVFFHEIPHEVGDFALLIQGGFSKAQAMQAQFFTAIGAYLGTLIGIAINMWAVSGNDEANIIHTTDSEPLGFFGTNVVAGDLTLPFTAGGFLYIATVGVIPEILESGANMTGFQKVKQALCQLIALVIGIGIMFAISWNE